MTTIEVAPIIASLAIVKEWHQPAEQRLLCGECALEQRHQIVTEARLDERGLLSMFHADVTCDRCGEPLRDEEADQDDQ